MKPLKVKPRRRAPGAGRPRKPRTLLPDGEALALSRGLGLKSSIERLQRAEQRAASDFEKALATRNPDLVSACRKSWLDLSEQLRKTELATPEAGQANASLVEVKEVERQFSRVVTAFRISLENLPKTLPPRLAGQDEITIHEVLKKSVNQILADLSAGAWPKTA